jgi:ABC-type amino acid transport substrate-binding protein
MFRNRSVLVLVLLCLPWVWVADAQPARQSTLEVGIKEAPPFVIRGEEGQWSGLAVSLWEQIAKDDELRFAYEEYDLTGLLEALEQGKIDVAVGAISMTPDREQKFDYTHAYFLSGLGIAVSEDQTRGWLGGLRRFFSVRFLQVVGALVLVLLVSGLLVWLFERRRNAEMFGGPTHQGIGSGFWWAAVTMTTVGYGDKAPKTAGGRLVALFWMFTSLIIISGFTAAIASALTLGALDSSIEGPEDLVELRVATVSGSSSADWLVKQGIGYTGASDVEQALAMLREQRVDAVVYDAPILDYLVRTDPSGELAVINRRFEFHSYALALPTDSKLAEPLNQKILEIISSADWRAKVLQMTGREP